MKSEVYKEKVNSREELVARIMNSAALIKQERQDKTSGELHVLLPRELKSALKSAGPGAHPVSCTKKTGSFPG
jgi:hypothetical protein